LGEGARLLGGRDPVESDDEQRCGQRDASSSVHSNTKEYVTLPLTPPLGAGKVQVWKAETTHD
jgi:hypothetical protein